MQEMTQTSSWESLVNETGFPSMFTFTVWMSLTRFFGMQMWAYPVVLEVPFVLKLRSCVVELYVTFGMVEFDTAENSLPAKS